MTHKRVFDYTITIDQITLALQNNTAAFTQHSSLCVWINTRLYIPDRSHWLFIVDLFLQLSIL